MKVSVPNSRAGWHVSALWFLVIHLANTLHLGPDDDDEPELQAPADPVANPMMDDAVSFEGILALPLFQNAVLATIVLALLVFVLRRRRMSPSVIEKSLA
jgi:hypothetical protein